MMRLARTGLTAIVVAGITAFAGVLPAQAKPLIAPNTEYIDIYYSNAQHTTVVGEYTTVYPLGCTDWLAWGTRTTYYTVQAVVCQS
jgi:hypothetical protein